MTAGELTYIQPDKTTVYKAGDCFFETGAVSHTAHNATQEPAVLLNFQLLPADWSKGSAIPPEQPAAKSHTRNTRSCMSLRGRVPILLFLVGCAGCEGGARGGSQ